MSFVPTVILLWLAGNALIRILASRSNGRVAAILHERQIVINWWSVSVTTTAFNATLERIGKRHRRLLSHWFLLGVGFGFLGLLASVVILASHLVSSALTPLSPFASPPVHHVPSAVRAARTPDGRPWWIPSLAWRLAKARDHDWLRDGHAWTDRGKRKLRKLREWRRRHKSRKRAQLRGFHSRSESERSAQRTGRRLARLHLHDAPGRPGRVTRITAPMLPAVARFVTEIHAHPVSRPNAKVPPRHAPRQAPVAAHAVPPDSAPREVPRPPASPPIPPRRGDERRTPTGMLKPLLPGVTIPAFHVLYIIIAVLAAACIHELGHALAAGMCDAQVTGVGCILAVMFPGAYVNLQGVEKLPIMSQLKVYCAGAWHNFTGALAALLLIAVLPGFLSPLYATGAGALVVFMPAESPLRHYMQPGDIVLGFGRFPVSDGGDSFRSAVHNLVLSNDSVGFCVSETLFKTHSRKGDLCCDLPPNATAPSHLQCFSAVGIRKRRACIPPDVVAGQTTCRHSRDCPGYRPPGAPAAMHMQDGGAVPHAGRVLQAAVPGPGPRQRMPPPPPPSPHSGPRPPRELEKCFRAVLPDDQRLVDIRVKSVATGHTNRLIYEGFPNVLGASVSVSSYVPRGWAVLPSPVLRMLAVADLPNHLERLLQYFASISLAIALLNMAPVFKLDGEYSTPLFLRMTAPKMSSFRLERFKGIALRVGTALLGLNVVISLFQYDVQSLVPR